MRLKTLNGAPLRASLDFSPEALLSPGEAARFLTPDTPFTKSTRDEPLQWRSIAPTEQRLRSEWSQPYLPNGGFDGEESALSFLMPGIGASVDADPEDTTNLDTIMTIDEAALDDTFEYQSLIFHDTLLSSQIATAGLAQGTATSQSFVGTSFDSTTSTDQESFQQTNTNVPILQVPATLKLTALGTLPSAAHLRRIYPQTPTPNILCALTAYPEDREVFVKKGGYKMRLREIVVADDTKADFKVTFWQKPSRRNHSHNTLGHVLQRMKPGDVLLLRNIALNAFRDDVYGQSLNTSIARVQTSVEILMSSGSISSRQLGALPAPVVTAFMRVKKWASAHIATKLPATKKRRDESQQPNRSTKRILRSSHALDDDLPPDTMESV